MGRYGSCNYFYTLYDAVVESFPAVSNDNARIILREVILAPDDYTVEFSDSVYTKMQIFNLLGQSLKDSCIEDTPEQTHYNLMDKSAEVIKHMNDGYISQDDYKERKEYLELIAKYEFCLFASLAFLRVSNLQNNEKLCDRLILNIIRLREINDLIQSYTRDAVDIEIGREEFERAKPIYKMLKSLQGLGYDYNFSPKERANLNIDHDNDEDLSDRFNYYNWLKRLMLLQLRKETPTEIVVSQSSENRQNFNVSQDISEKIAQLRGTMQKRIFDKDRFIVLEKASMSSAEEDIKIS